MPSGLRLSRLPPVPRARAHGITAVGWSPAAPPALRFIGVGGWDGMGWDGMVGSAPEPSVRPLKEWLSWCSGLESLGKTNGSLGKSKNHLKECWNP